ncbi:MAG: cation transporter [Dysgonamonadaceae bacterium]|jgi:copper chaperone CopZ|nr:cation transporter [Dysgonamonadaceae bacterium]
MKAKKVLLVMLAMFTLTGIAVTAQDNTEPKEKKEQVKDRKVEKKKKSKAEEVSFKANMTCEKCQARIEKTVTWEKGVKDLTVNLDEKLVTIKYDPDKTDEVTLQKAIEALGYTAEKQEKAAKQD